MVLNFYARPATLPAPVVERIHGDLINFQGTGMGVMEISHRATGSFMAARPCWGVASSFLTCTLTVGGPAGVLGGRPCEPRAALSVTVTVNHDVVDGAPAARFAETFGQLLEGGAGLEDGFPAEATQLSEVGHALAR